MNRVAEVSDEVKFGKSRCFDRPSEGGIPADRFLLAERRCGSPLCKGCCVRWGLRVRERLAERYRALGVTGVGFLTLTIDPKVLGEDLRGQWYAVRDGRLVGQAMRFWFDVVGMRRPYWSVRQFHPRSGQLHVHVLIDGMGLVPKEVLRMMQAWGHSHLGNVDYKYRASDVAIGYVTRYLTKGSDCPDWVRDLISFRCQSCSKGYWGSSGSLPRDTDDLRERYEGYAVGSTVGERLDSCGGSCAVLVRDRDGVHVVGERVGGVDEVARVLDKRGLVLGKDWGWWSGATVWLADRAYEGAWRSLGLVADGAGPLSLEEINRCVKVRVAASVSGGSVGICGGSGDGRLAVN